MADRSPGRTQAEQLAKGNIKNVPYDAEAGVPTSEAGVKSKNQGYLGASKPKQPEQPAFVVTGTISPTK